MSGHTPGPWKYAKGKYGYQIWQDVKKGFGNHWIANLKCESCPADDLSNARLIAAAPELLEMLLALECDINTMVYCYDKRPENFWRAMAVAKENAILARAAIAKAKGEV